MPAADKLQVVVVDDQLTMRTLVRSGLSQIGITNARDFPGAQEAWTTWHNTVYSFLKLPPEYMLFCGLALGYADEAAPINRWRAPREPLDAFASFDGFAD